MKILWHSVAPWAPTGYGQQTATFVHRLRALGHDVCISAYYGHQGCIREWRGDPEGSVDPPILVLPPYNASYGTDVLVPHALHFFGAEDSDNIVEASARGLIITLGDVWTFEAPVLPQMASAAWVPVDHLTCPEVTRNWFVHMNAVPIAMSRFGEAALADVGLSALYVPHGIDTAAFCPGDKAEARERVGLPADAFVVGMVANNIGRDGNRKAFSEQIAAFSELQRRHSDAHLYLHTDVDAPSGARLRSLLDRLLPEGSYSFTDTYTYRVGQPRSRIADIYRGIDVLTNCSYGEGFGIPIVEAQACGTPVIVTDSTAMRELCGSGWKVGYEQVWHDSQAAWASIPRIGDIAAAMLDAYENAGSVDVRAEAHAFAQQYDADVVTERYWKPALDRLELALVDRAAHAARLRLQGPPPKLREAAGLIWLDRGPGSDDWVSFDHEPWLEPVFDELLPPGGVLLDVGAHVGRWSLRLASRASHVVSVEANPSTARTLRRHIAMNAIENVTVVEMAAWDGPALLHLDDPNGRIDGGGTRTVAGDAGEVPAGRLDSAAAILDVLDRFGRLDLIKLDVEGSDIRAIRGMVGLLARYGPALLVECHDVYGYYAREDLEAAIEEAGYSHQVIWSVPTKWMPGYISEEVHHADYLVCRPVPAPIPAHA